MGEFIATLVFTALALCITALVLLCTYAAIVLLWRNIKSIKANILCRRCGDRIGRM